MCCIKIFWALRLVFTNLKSYNFEVPIFVFNIIFCLGLTLLSLAESTKVFLVLGCNMGWLQQDRINSALNYWSNLDHRSDVIWYLSGGVKNAIETSIAEAEVMSQGILSSIKQSQIVLDTNAVNTAENFRNFHNFISRLENLDVEIVIVTSAFHKARAEKFFYGFFPKTVNPQWVLGSLECPTCANDELFHMRNVDSDIAKAKENPTLAF